MPGTSPMLAVAAGFAAAAYQVGPAASWLVPVRRVTPGLAGRSHAMHVALTFDDGPRPGSTTAVLDVLAKCGVRATFFMLGRSVRRHRGLAAEVAAAGHELAVHGWDHGYLLGRGKRRVHDELARTADAVAGITGVPPRWFRPAFGVLTGPSVLAARSLGLRPVLWTVWGRDWAAAATGASIADQIIDGLTPGATVLLHDADHRLARPTRCPAVEALPRVASAAALRGLTLGPLSEHGLERGARWPTGGPVS